MNPVCNHWMLRLASDRWSLVSAKEPHLSQASGAWTSAETGKLAEELANFFAERQLTPSSLVIGLDSSLCLSTQFTVASAKQLRKRDALVFQLEETLPISAEEVVADFLVRQREVFALAAETAVLEPVVVELTRVGFSVEALVPEILLAVEEHVRIYAWPARHQVLWLEPDRWELVTIDQGQPTSWLRLPAAPNALLQSLRAAELLTVETTPIVAYGPSETIAQLQSQIPAEWLVPPDVVTTGSLAAFAGLTATRVLDGHIDPPMQLLRGPLATSVKRRSPLARERRLVQCAAALFLTALAIAQFGEWRTAQRTLADHIAGQADVFRQLYPDKRLPVGIETRLASDLRRLRGVRGETTELPSGVEALQVVQQVLAALPADMRFRLLEIRVENGRLSLSGEVRSHGDADRIAAALRKQGLRVSSPSTQQLPQQGVDFRLTAEVAPAEEKSA